MLHCTSIYVVSKSLSQIFKILFQTEDINILFLCGIYFSRYAQVKSPFPDEKTSTVKSETHFNREAIENQCVKLTTENSVGSRFTHILMGRKQN